MYVYKSMAKSMVTNAVIGAISLAAQDHIVVRGGKAPVSACKPLCAIFIRESSVYSISGVKANVGHLWAKSKVWKKTDLRSECADNFLTIFAKVVLREKLNFLSRFSEWL